MLEFYFYLIISFFFSIIISASGVARARICKWHAVVGNVGENGVTPASVVDAVPLCWLSSSSSSSHSNSGGFVVIFAGAKTQTLPIWAFLY